MYLYADINAYGTDWDGPLPEEADYDETVYVPDVQVLLNNHQIQLLVDSVDPLKQSKVFGIDLYIETKQIVNNILN